MDLFDDDFASTAATGADDVVEEVLSDGDDNEDTPLELSDQLPFDDLEVSPMTPLLSCRRAQCAICRNSIRYYCAECLLPCTPIPRVPQLPFKIDVWKHKAEISGKSTALHAKILDYRDDVRVLQYPGDTESYTADPDDVLVLYPNPVSYAPGSFSRLIVIDGTWYQANQMVRDCPFLRNNKRRIRYVTLKEPPRTSFWRFQQKSPNYLATIEAIWCILREYERAHPLPKDTDTSAATSSKTDTKGNPVQFMPAIVRTSGRTYDDILWYYVFQYRLIVSKYKDNPRRVLNSRLTGDFREGMERARQQDGAT
ncbi:hypothetical protein RI367_000789 [Sorochytrium milnesiophthora]